MAHPLSAAIFDCDGPVLTADEKAFFKDVNPYGYILFARHCESPGGVRRLTDSLRELSGRDDLPILIDQEGGRVARLKPPVWRKYPPAALFAKMAESDKEQAHQAVYLNARLIAQDLSDIGITVDCAPLADIPTDGAHDIIGDRAFGNDAQRIIYLGRAMAAGLKDGGIVPVLKHVPGHGRAGADSHLELPIVDADIETLRATDFVPFKAMAGLPMAMTAHVLYSKLDPDNMATQSPKIISLIREELGFEGLLMTDDISMKAMQGDLAERSRASLAAGCDVVLHCNASLEEKQQAMQGIGVLEGIALERGIKAMQLHRMPEPIDREDAIAQLDSWITPFAA